MFMQQIFKILIAQQVFSGGISREPTAHAAAEPLIDLSWVSDQPGPVWGGGMHGVYTSWP